MEKKVKLLSWFIFFGIVCSPVWCQEPAQSTPKMVPGQTEGLVSVIAESISPPPAIQSCPAVPSNDGNSSECILGGASFYYLKPFMTSNNAYTITTSNSNGVVPVSNTSNATLSKNFDWDLQPAWAIWIGYTSPTGLGVRSRYFHFDEASSNSQVSLRTAQANVGGPGATTSIAPSGNLSAINNGIFGSPTTILGLGTAIPNSTDNLLFGSNLKIDAVDVEATYAWKSGGWSLLGGVGARYLHLAQNYQAGLINNGGGFPVSEVETLTFSHSFQGAGPTLSGQTTWQIYQTNLSLFAGARASLLAGRTNILANVSQKFSDPTGLLAGIPGTPSITTLTNQVPNTTDDVMPVVEFEVGLEYSLDVWGNKIYFRGATVDQTYFGAGNASTHTGNLGLLGFQLSLGANY